jgi:hypothetical protein
MIHRLSALIRSVFQADQPRPRVRGAWELE